jgi:hypothetical protein
MSAAPDGSGAPEDPHAHEPPHGTLVIVSLFLVAVVVTWVLVYLLLLQG